MPSRLRKRRVGIDEPQRVLVDVVSRRIGLFGVRIVLVDVCDESLVIITKNREARIMQLIEEIERLLRLATPA